MEIKIIIQQTEDGSKVVFPIGYNEFAPEYIKFQFFLKDEAHKADFANAYSLQINHEYKVYSLISSEIKDYLGRSGSFFAIRVIISNQKSIDEIHNLLNNIKDRYMEHYQNKTMEELSFKDLTDAVEDNTFSYNNNAIVTHGIEKEAFVLWDKISSINSYFLHKATHIVKCLYIFEKDKTESVVYERMLPFEEVKPLVRKIEIIANGLLESLKVNDIEINKPSSNSFDLITTTDAKVIYKRRDKKEFKVLNGLENSLILQHEYKVQPPPKNEPETPKAIIIAFSILIVLLTGIIGWLYWDEYKKEKSNTVLEPSNIPQIVEPNQVLFKEIDSSKLGKSYQIIIPKGLESYEFIYNIHWSYLNKAGHNKVVDFNISNIKEILESNKEIKFNDTIKNNFIAELEKISGKEIPEENKPKEVKADVKQNKPLITPAAKEKPTNNKPSNNTPPAKKDDDKPNSEK